MRTVGSRSSRWHTYALRLTASAGVLAVAASLLTPEAAEARKKTPQPSAGPFSFFDAPPPPRPYRVYNTRRTNRPATGAPATAAKEAVPAEAPVKGPLVITVSLGQQRLTVHDIDGPIAEAPISSGTAAFPTLQGVFTILEKSKIHYSNLYGGAPMPNMQRITWSGTAMHAGVLPGYPASHGCIRLPHNFSKKLYGMTKLGTRVIVTRDPIVPKSIEHPNLIAPLPAEQATAAVAVDAKAPRDYETVRSLTLIASASAAEDAAVPQAPLTGYRAKRAAEKQRTEEALKAAEAAKIPAEEAVKAGVADAEKAKADARAANVEAARLAQEVRKAEGARQDGDRALVAFERKYASAGAIRADVLEKASATEQELEDKTFELGKALDTARAIADEAKKKAEDADRAAAEAVAKTKDLAKKLADINTEIRTATATLESFKKQEQVRKLPVSVLISRSAGRLYVRQGYQPIFDVPVTFKDPEAAIGTHVFTALEQTGPTAMRWSSSTIPYTPPAAETKKKNKRNPQYDVPPTSTALPQTPTAALDRVTIPEDVRERIADVMKPGSSIVISDYGISHQTGQFTDFILLTR